MAEAKTVIITGGNTGIGYECAKTIALAKEGWHIVIAGRDQTRTAQAVEQLKAATGYLQIEAMLLDLASLASVRAFVAAFTSRTLPPLQAIVCNAGLQVATGTTYTKEGFETTFGVNHLGHFLLVNLLLPRLTAPARIVFVSSGTHDPAERTGMPAPRIDINNLKELAWPSPSQESAGALGRVRYTTSKLCNILCTYELARQLAAEGKSHTITVNAYDPGGTPGTGLTRDYPAAARFVVNQIIPLLFPLLRLAGVHVNTVDAAGKALARLVLDPALEGVTGKYFAGMKEIRSSKESYNAQLAAHLWQFSDELVSNAAIVGSR